MARKGSLPITVLTITFLRKRESTPSRARSLVFEQHLT